MSLSKQYAINLLLDNQYSKKAKPHYLLIGNLTDKQCLKIKSSIVDTKNHLNKVHPFFNRLYKELLSRFNLVDNFLITSHFIQWTIKTLKLEMLKFTYLIKSLMTLLWIQILFSLFPIPISRITLQLHYYTSILVKVF